MPDSCCPSSAQIVGFLISTIPHERQGRAHSSLSLTNGLRTAPVRLHAGAQLAPFNSIRSIAFSSPQFRQHVRSPRNRCAIAMLPESASCLHHCAAYAAAAPGHSDIHKPSLHRSPPPAPDDRRFCAVGLAAAGPLIVLRSSVRLRQIAARTRMRRTGRAVLSPGARQMQECPCKRPGNAQTDRVPPGTKGSQRCAHNLRIVCRTHSNRAMCQGVTEQVNAPRAGHKKANLHDWVRQRQSHLHSAHIVASDQPEPFKRSSRRISAQVPLAYMQSIFTAQCRLRKGTHAARSGCCPCRELPHLFCRNNATDVAKVP